METGTASLISNCFYLGFNKERSAKRFDNNYNYDDRLKFLFLCMFFMLLVLESASLPNPEYFCGF